MGYSSVTQQEYDKITKKRKSLKLPKELLTIFVILLEKIRGNSDSHTGYVNAVNVIASTKINSFFIKGG
jgi:hypothetical protein